VLRHGRPNAGHGLEKVGTAAVRAHLPCTRARTESSSHAPAAERVRSLGEESLKPRPVWAAQTFFQKKASRRGGTRRVVAAAPLTAANRAANRQTVNFSRERIGCREHSSSNVSTANRSVGQHLEALQSRPG